MELKERIHTLRLLLCPDVLSSLKMLTSSSRFASQCSRLSTDQRGTRSKQPRRKPKKRLHNVHLVRALNILPIPYVVIQICIVLLQSRCQQPGVDVPILNEGLQQRGGA